MKKNYNICVVYNMLGVKGDSRGLIGGRDRASLVGGLRNIGYNAGGALQSAGTIGSLYAPEIGVPTAVVGSILKTITKK